jgi:hypothetical protein
MNLQTEVRHKSEDIAADVLLSSTNCACITSMPTDRGSRGTRCGYRCSDPLVGVSTLHEAAREAYRRGEAGEGPGPRLTSPLIATRKISRFCDAWCAKKKKNREPMPIEPDACCGFCALVGLRKVCARRQGTHPHGRHCIHVLGRRLVGAPHASCAPRAIARSHAGCAHSTHDRR